MPSHTAAERARRPGGFGMPPGLGGQIFGGPVANLGLSPMQQPGIQLAPMLPGPAQPSPQLFPQPGQPGVSPFRANLQQSIQQAAAPGSVFGAGTPSVAPVSPVPQEAGFDFRGFASRIQQMLGPVLQQQQSEQQERLQRLQGMARIGQFQPTQGLLQTAQVRPGGFFG